MVHGHERIILGGEVEFRKRKKGLMVGMAASGRVVGVWIETGFRGSFFQLLIMLSISRGKILSSPSLFL